MYRVFDTKEKQWVTDDVYLTPDDKLFKVKRSVFGWLKSFLPLPEDRYVYHEDIDLYDKNGTLIFIGDILKAHVNEDKDIVGVVVYAHELSSYIILCEEDSEFYTLGSEVCEYIEIIGNVFDNFGEEKDE